MQIGRALCYLLHMGPGAILAYGLERRSKTLKTGLNVS
jgi:hypothetical protein